MVRKYDAPGCQCCEDCCYPCAGGLCVQSSTLTISGFPNSITHAPLGSPLSALYRTTLTGFAAINGTYNFNLQDGSCGAEQVYELPINGSEEQFNPSTFVWSTISTGGYLGILRVNKDRWDFLIRQNSGTPFYFGASVPGWVIAFNESNINLCLGPFDRTTIRGFVGTTVFQRTQTTSVLV